MAALAKRTRKTTFPEEYTIEEQLKEETKETGDVALIDELNFWEKVPVNEQIRDEFDVPHNTVNLLDSTSSKSQGTLEFRITSDNEHFINLSKCYFIIQLKITKADGTAISRTPDHLVSVVNNAGHSIIKNLLVKLNNVTVTSSHHTYPYKMYINNLLHYTADSLNSKLQAQGFFKDTAEHMDAVISYNTTSKKYVCDNHALLHRFALFDSTTFECQLLIPLGIDLARQSKYLLPKIQMDITIHLNDANFVLMYSDLSTEAYDFQVKEATFWVHKIRASDAAVLAIEQVLTLGKPVSYEFTRTDVRLLTLTKDQATFSFDPVFVGSLPLKAIVGIIDSDAANGKRSLNPFNFTHNNVVQIRFIINGKMYPAVEELFDFSNRKITRLFYNLYDVTGCDFNHPHSFSLSRRDFEGGYTLFATQFSPDVISEYAIRHIRKEGSFRIDIKFNSNLTKTLTAVLWLEFDSKILINSQRQVIRNYE
jgi:hypothetical protein